jgi:PPOX class probable F420-dependent enzyme
MELNQAARDLIGAGANATMVTLNPSGTPNVSVVWVALDSAPEGDDIITAHLGEYVKVRNVRLNPLVVLTILDHRHWSSFVRPYLKLTGTATVEEGGAPQLLERLVKVLGNPDSTFVVPPPDAPPGFITRIHIDRVAGTGPWKC